MGESAACLVRSFSQPSPSSSKEKQGNPLHRALTTSISFGRFMSESLDWEKWSAFTHNRHMEELEKYSRPGSVAEKKAYFEAHYKRRKAAAVLEQQQNAAASDTSEINIRTENHSGLPSVSESVEKSSYEVDTETPEGESVSCIASDTHNVVEKTKLEDAPAVEAEQVAELSANVENSVQSSNHPESDKESSTMNLSQESGTCSKDAAIMGDATSSEKKKPSFISAKSPNGGALKVKPLLKPTTPVSVGKSDLTSPNEKKTIRNQVNKKRSAPSALHMSINFARAGETTMASSPGCQRTANSRLIKAPAKTSKGNMTRQGSTRVSVTGTLKFPSVTPLPESRRPGVFPDNSSSCNRKVDGKVQPHLSSSSKLPSRYASQARSPTVSSSFVFKSEERAAKRKEFFQKLEQKLKAKEAEKEPLPAKSKVKSETESRHLRDSVISKVGSSDLRDLSHSIASRATITAKVSPKAKTPDIVKKVPTTPCSPNLQGKPSKIQDNNSRPPWGFSARLDSQADVTGKNNRPPIYSGKSSSKKIMRENASPNIRPWV